MVTSIFAEEHEALRASLDRFGTRVLAAGIARWEAARAVPEEIFRAARQLGSPELAADPIAGVVLAEALGAHGAGGVGTALLDDALAASILGQELAPLALVDDQAVSLTADGDGWRVDGLAHAVVNGTTAEVLLVLPAEGPALKVAVASPGLERAAVAAPLGRHAAGQARVTFDGVTLDGTAVLDHHAAGVRTRRWLLEAAAALSAAQATWDQAREYGLQREAFGRPIARFQVNRHALAQLATRIVSGRQLVHDTAWRIARSIEAETQAEAEDLAARTAMARRYAARVANEVADRCLQLYGGYGYSMEFPVQRAWRDARHLRVDGGPDEVLRRHIAAGLARTT